MRDDINGVGVPATPHIAASAAVSSYGNIRHAAMVVVDPDMRVIGDVRVKAPADMLRAQIKGAKTARGRWIAAQALGILYPADAAHGPGKVT